MEHRMRLLLFTTRYAELQLHNTPGQPRGPEMQMVAPENEADTVGQRIRKNRGVDTASVAQLHINS